MTNMILGRKYEKYDKSKILLPVLAIHEFGSTRKVVCSYSISYCQSLLHYKKKKEKYSLDHYFPSHGLYTLLEIQ
jgi:hypothetical protein